MAKRSSTPAQAAAAGGWLSGAPGLGDMSAEPPSFSQLSASCLLKEDLAVEIAGLNHAVGNAQVQYHRGQGLLLAHASVTSMEISKEVTADHVEKTHAELDAGLAAEGEMILRTEPDAAQALLELTERLSVTHSKACTPGECWVDVSGDSVEHVQLLVDAGIAERQPDGYQLIRIAF